MVIALLCNASCTHSNKVSNPLHIAQLCLYINYHFLLFVTSGTQDLTEDDHMKEQLDTADLLEAADNCQQAQISGLDDDVDLHEMGSQSNDEAQGLQQQPGPSVHDAQPNGHAWPQALLHDSSSTAGPMQQQHPLSSEEIHFSKLAEARQTHMNQRGFHLALQDQVKLGMMGTRA